MLVSVQAGHLIDRSICNQRDGIGLPAEFGCCLRIFSSLIDKEPADQSKTVVPIGLCRAVAIVVLGRELIRPLLLKRFLNLSLRGTADQAPKDIR
jgi:hypothetical protein